MSAPMPRPARMIRTTLSSRTCSLAHPAWQQDWRNAATQATPVLHSRAEPAKRGTRSDPLRVVGPAYPRTPWATRRRRARRSASSSPPAARGSPPPTPAFPRRAAASRVKGLRREEVALLAGVSPEYYVRLERGQATGPSAGVVDAVAEVLGLDGDERAHLGRLLAALTPEARKRGAGSRRRSRSHRACGCCSTRWTSYQRCGVRRPLRHPRRQRAGAGALSRRSTTCPGGPTAPLPCCCNQPRARGLFPEWERIAGDTVAMLRIEAGRHPDDPELMELIGQLSTRSAEIPHPLGRGRRPGAPRRHQGLPAPAHGRGPRFRSRPAHQHHQRPGARRVHPAAREPRGQRNAPAGQLERRGQSECEPDSRNRRPDT